MTMDDSGAWSLHPQLAADAVSLTDLPLTRLLVMNDANYPWLVLVPRRARVSEIMDLLEDERTQLMREVAATAGALKTLAACDKINIGALGNIVSQLHVHVVARHKNDPAWPAPVWGRGSPRPYDKAALAAFRAGIMEQLERLPGSSLYT